MAQYSIQCDALPLFKQGKVRSVYTWEDQLILVASDRVSAFDCILPTPIPKKGQVLTDLSAFWFKKTAHIVPNHYISHQWCDFPDFLEKYQSTLMGRSMIATKTTPFPVECVVRGYLMGSGWLEYQQSQSVCGISLPPGLQQGQQLPEPIFTPATKADEGHDENISFEKMVDLIGDEDAHVLKEYSLKLYHFGAAYCRQHSIVLADTKFEYGRDQNSILLIDEVMTPDSSRYWHQSDYRIGISPPSYDKQIVRDYLESIQWNKQPPIPSLPADIVEHASSRYQQIYQLIVNG